MNTNEVKGYIQNCITKMELQEAYDLIIQYKKMYKYDDEIASMEAIINIYDGNYDEGLKCIQEGLKANISSPDLYFTMGNIYELKEKNENAYLCYENALVLSRDENKSTIIDTINNLKEKVKIKVNKCSIVILTYNNLDYTKVCIDSIRKYNDKSTYEIIIVDNNSTDGTVEWIKEQKDIKYILNTENKGFPAGCNQGIKIVEKNNDIFLLNNDTVIMPNSIFNLRMALYSNDDIGATGAVSNSVSNYQQISEVYNNFDSYMDYSYINNIHDINRYEKRIKLIGFAMMIKRRVLNKVGLLDEIFSPGNFEDDDISLRIVSSGYRLLLCKDSYIHHFGSVSFSKIDNYNELLLSNSKKFKEKWGFTTKETIVSKDINIYNLLLEFNNKKNINILEIGCGCGENLLQIKDFMENINVYGVDNNYKIVNIANEIEGIKVLHGNHVEQIRDINFDIVIVSKGGYLNILKKIKCSNDYKLIENRNYIIGERCDIRGIDKIDIGRNVVIQESSWINIAHRDTRETSMIEIQDGVNIGRRGIVSAANKVVLEEKVLLGPNVYISDCGHEYGNIDIPIIDQGIDCYSNEIIIGKGTWIGMNSVIVGNVRIGNNCVIGANSVVNKDIPDYCVAVGAPAKVVKVYNLETKEWERVYTDEEIQKKVSNRENKKIKKIQDLKSLQVEVSSICNLKCPQCFNNIKGHKSGIISEELWEEKISPILNQLKEIHLVGIGEPLLCKNFFKYVEECSERGVEVHTTSNLQLVNEEIAEKFITSGLKYLSFSCDGATEEVYNRIRVNGDFNKLIKSLELIIKYKEKLKSDYPKLILNFGAMKSNIEDLPEVIKLAKKFEIDQVIAYHDVVYVKEMENESLYYEQETSDKIFTEAEEIANRLKVNYFKPGLFNNPIKYNEIKLKKYCSYPDNHLWIYSDGRVGPCCMDFPDRIILGDLRKKSIEEIWNGEEIRELRESLTNNIKKECKYCLMHGKMDISNKKFLIKY